VKRDDGICGERTFVRDSSLFSLALVLGGFCRLIRSFITAKLLGPEVFGTWRFINIFVDYLSLASLGTQPAMQRTIPFLRGKGDIKKLEAVFKTAFATNFFSSIWYCLVVFTWSFFVEETSDARALAAFSVVIFLLAWMNYTNGFFMATGLYSLRTRLETLHAVSTLLFSVGLLYFWGLYGAIVGLGISAILIGIISVRELWQHSAFKIDWQILFNLIVTGLPVMGNGLLETAMNTADKILIAALLSRQELGIYGVGGIGVAIMATIPSGLGQMLFVKFAEMDGQNKTKEYTADIIDKSTFVISSLSAPIICVAIACFPIAVVFLLPQYVQGILAGEVLLAGTFFLGVSLPITNWYVSTGRYVPVLLIRGLVVAAQFIAVYVAIINHPRLEFIALCVLCAFAIFSTAIMTVSSGFFGKPFLIGFISAAKNQVPFLSILTAIWIQYYVYPVDAYVLSLPLFTSCILGLVVSLAVSLPFVIRSNRNTQIVGLILNGFLGKRNLIRDVPPRGLSLVKNRAFTIAHSYITRRAALGSNVNPKDRDVDSDG
jgi:O-antigen/teichoic acid export membrane protein